MTNEEHAYSIGWQFGIEAEDQGNVLGYRRRLPQALEREGLGPVWLDDAVKGFHDGLRAADEDAFPDRSAHRRGDI